MFSKNEFNSALAKYGVTPRMLAERIGMKLPTLYSRIRGEVPFTLSDVSKIAVVVPLTDEQLLSIFFAK